MTVIRKLDPVLVNKIAAGEVIERPASVVKELVENALDAGALRIDVTLEAGGTKLIRVTDNGHGIARDDLALAVAPHATSKIYSDDDLFNIRSLGFRGEALASIASVSHLRLVSRSADQLEAYELRLEDERDTSPSDSRRPSPQACAAPLGTTVEIRHLFYNVPARRKFLRQPQTECSHATEQIARLALAHPQVAFTLTHNGRTLRNLPATEDRRTRIADFYGAELAECLLDIHRVERGLEIAALIAPPAQSRASTKWQYIFLNGRHITDRRLGYAVREAFRGLVEHDRFPVVFIFLTIDPHEFDANVHPTKIEVRWRDAGLVQSQVLAALRESLLSHDLTPALRLHRGDASRDSYGRQTDGAAQQRARQALADYLKRVDPTQTRLGFKPPPFSTDNLRSSIAGTVKSPPVENHERPAPVVNSDSRPADQSVSFSQTIESEGATTDADATNGTSDPHAAPASVMQIHNTYLVAQTESGVIIVDQHALHERILYERFRERVLAGPLESQGLLIPETIEASAAQTETADRHKMLLKKLGIELSPFGPATLAVQGFPSLLHKVDIKVFVADLLDKLAESDAGESEETLIHAALDMMACKAAVKAGDPLTTEEIYALLEQRHLTDRASNCPHGRPTTLELTTKDLEKQFKRI
ncbi:MAG: DNA mismatch repair endonuclease MutL [Phycisphaerales bacterium]|nr:DNA mismatch repair endonuclease MutL [Phycisphaerales bacterium]